VGCCEARHYRANATSLVLWRRPPQDGGHGVRSPDFWPNWAKEYFSRLRRAEIGIHHHIAGAYLLRYAQESSWREDNRRFSIGEQYLMTAMQRSSIWRLGSGRAIGSATSNNSLRLQRNLWLIYHIFEPMTRL